MMIDRTLIFRTLFLGLLWGCSHSAPPGRGIASSYGDTIIFREMFPYGIEIANCPRNTDPLDEASYKKCVADTPVGYISVASFRLALQGIISPDRSKVLSPLTKEEIAAYVDPKSHSPLEIKKIEAELRDIESSLKVYSSPAILAREKKLTLELNAHEAKVLAIRKVSDLIDEAIALIMKSPLSLSTLEYDKGTFLYTALKNFKLKEGLPCGLNENDPFFAASSCLYSLEDGWQERVFYRVARTIDSKHFFVVQFGIFRGERYYQYWSDRLPQSMTLEEATQACRQSTFLGMRGWRLPTAKEYEESEKMGIRAAYPNMAEYLFWSNTGKVFNGTTGKLKVALSTRKKSVKCVMQRGDP